MGNKPSRDDNSSVGSTPISLISSADGNFALGGTWKCNALLAVLETLFRVPCLCECILGAQIDQKCRSTEQKAIYELQLLFDVRANASKGTLVAADQFLVTLLETQSTANSQLSHQKIFDQNDPSDLYNAISQLIVSSLPELRGIFYDRNDNKLSNKKERDVQIKSIKSNGISINLVPDVETLLENEIETEKLPRPKILETTPIFVVNTKYFDEYPKKVKFPLSCYSLSFPTSLNLGKLTPSTAEMERSDLIYHLHGVVAEVQGSEGTRTIKSFSRTSPDLNAWCESAIKPRPTNLLEIQDLGIGEDSCVRVLIYIQSDLSLMTSSHLPIAGTKIFKEASTNPKLNSSNGIPIFQQITGLSGSLSPSHSLVNPNLNRGGMMNKGSTLKTISQGFCTPLGTGVGFGPGADEGGQPMEEEVEDDDEDDDDDEEDDDDYEYESDGDEEDYDSDSYESPEYEDETPAECQCPTCRRERDQKLRDLARLKSEKELLEQVKREKLKRLMTPKTPGTRTQHVHFLLNKSYVFIIFKNVIASIRY
jgi:hypothetical protein